MLILVGKSAVGKDTIQKELINLGYKPVVSYTTRPPRYNEVDGIAYHFISKEEFLKKKQEGFFAETTSYNVASGDTWCYGSAIEDLAKDKVMIVNPEGLKQIKKIKTLNPIAFYLMADEETIWNRLRKRGDDIEEARRRLNADDIDFTGIIEYVDFCLRNDLGINPEKMAKFINDLYITTKEIEHVRV